MTALPSRTAFIVSLLVVNIIIISGIVVRIGHLYKAGIYTYYDWIIGTIIIILICVVILHAFTGYAMIASKKLYKWVLISTTTAQVLLIVVTAIMMDPIIFMGLVASVTTTFTIIASLHWSSK
ncbi:MAG: hypothetical protein QXY96_02110 [Candidatus Methanomethylicaceae archaeon]